MRGGTDPSRGLDRHLPERPGVLSKETDSRWASGAAPPDPKHVRQDLDELDRAAPAPRSDLGALSSYRS